MAGISARPANTPSILSLIISPTIVGAIKGGCKLGAVNAKTPAIAWLAWLAWNRLCDALQRTSMNPMSAPIARIAIAPIAATAGLIFFSSGSASVTVGVAGSEFRILL